MDYECKCRYCGFNLDAGDVLEELEKTNMYEKDKLVQAASDYGWTPQNKIRFKKSIIIQQHNQFEICPECNGIWPEINDFPKEYYSEQKKTQN